MDVIDFLGKAERCMQEEPAFCTAVCPRTEFGGAVSLRHLERVCAEYGPGRQEAEYAVPPQSEQAVVVGGGLTGLSCALSLSRSGYPVTLYKASDRLGGSLWNLGEGLLPEEVILACPTCAKNFARFLPQIPTVALWELMAEHEFPAGAPLPLNIELAIFDPCAARAFSSMREAVRALAETAGIRVRELPFHGETAKCCGHRGLICGANPGLARSIYRNRASESPLDYMTYCTNCRDTLAGAGKRTWNLLDLLFGWQETAGEKPPAGLSERRENRRVLRSALTKTEGVRPPWAAIRLVLSEQLKEKMNAELILMDDLQQVIFAAEETGVSLTDETTGRTIAHHTHGITTYWVEYQRENDAWIVYQIYRHHMQTEEQGA